MSGSGSGPEPRSAAASVSTRVSSIASSGAPSVAGLTMLGLGAELPAGSQRVLEGLDTLGRIGVAPPAALGTNDEQSLKGLTAVRAVLGFRLRPDGSTISAKSIMSPVLHCCTAGLAGDLNPGPVAMQISDYLGDLRLRSVSMATTRVGSRQNLSSTAAAFMDLAAEEEEEYDDEEAAQDAALVRGQTCALGQHMTGLKSLRCQLCAPSAFCKAR